MKIKQLSETQYLNTMGSKMNQVTEIAEPMADIWNYAKQLLKDNLISQEGFLRRYVEAVYANNENTYQHVLLFTNQKNVYAVIIVDINDKSVFGHYILDLNEKYGLADNEMEIFDEESGGAAGKRYETDI